ncbi:hypothetical protein LEMLEM_LOCUS58, partial [Lemmus lemmus]
PLVGREAAHLPDHVPHELGVLCEAPSVPSTFCLCPHVCTQLLHKTRLSVGCQLSQGPACLSSRGIEDCSAK